MPTPTSDLEQDLAIIALQERELLLPAFDCAIAWQLGTLLRHLAIERGLAIVIDIRRFGQPHQPLFYSALPGTIPDNARWAERKANTVAHFHRSSYAIGLSLKRANATLTEKYALPEASYASHGGSFPLNVASAGVIGSLTISGLPQRDDHELAVEALCQHIGRSYADLRLSPLG